MSVYVTVTLYLVYCKINILMNKLRNILGIAITGMLTVIYSMLNNLGPWWYILTVVPYSLTGGFTVLFTGAYCYMSDVTSAENRSLR